MLTDLNIYHTRGSPELASLIQLFVHWLFFENFFIQIPILQSSKLATEPKKEASKCSVSPIKRDLGVVLWFNSTESAYLDFTSIQEVKITTK